MRLQNTHTNSRHTPFILKIFSSSKDCDMWKGSMVVSKGAHIVAAMEIVGDFEIM